jgi:hypothetical protein
MSFGSSAPQINYKPGGFFSGGLTAMPGAAGNYHVTESAALKDQIGKLQSTFGQQASDLANLRGTVAPGFSLFRQAGLADIAGQGQQNISNLRDSLAQRRVLGSSFANSSLSQAQADVEKQRTDFIAQSYLQELSASNQLIQEQYQAATQQFSVGINQMNFEAGIAAQLTQSANSTMASVATAQAQLDQQSAQANAAGLGSAIGYGVGLATTGVGSLSGPAYGGGSALFGDAYGGSSSNPLPGLGPEDYGPGF